MRAAVLKGFGDASNLVYEDFPDPEPEPGSTVVRLEAAALNWHDVLVRQGRYGSPLPHVPGSDGAGTRVDDGAEVMILPSLWWGSDERAPGPRWEILGDHRPGTYAEYVRVPSECVVRKPAGLSWSHAAALPLVGLTTYRALFTRARLRAGESLLVLGAGGGVATMAVSLAAGIGATVHVTSSATEKIDAAVALGATGGVSYRDPGWPTAARALSPDKAGFDVVLDPVGTWAQALEAVRPGGRVVVLGSARAERADLDVRRFYFGQYDLLGTTMGSLADFAGLVDLVERRGIVPPPVDREFPLSDTADAHRHLESGRGFGKVVLRIRGT
ncbi:zinc-binding dehydrogenase [Pseudonocardia sp. RS11V-5]|uniref:quinone oxidoreductase family protein n=1 Tax=Pseudonocardia terrae TaxID=2905831 RepID=UPI001E512378|nr:zinc-binding dehydrogenase [Pseudonocardia terrae]MCE3554475.1 zinc-binding dehydrogenase [Pseudonocardia terrae]